MARPVGTTASLLDRILAARARSVAGTRAARPAAGLEADLTSGAAPGAGPRRDFLAALWRAASERDPAVVAEFKRRSPSRGPLRPQADPADVARAYARAGAAALSVLTEGPFFGGSPGDLVAARAAVDLPVLRKDFVIDPYQVLESRWLGADAVLLIARCLEPSGLRALVAEALALGLVPLVEVHDRRDLEFALEAGAPAVAINHRDLATFQTDPSLTERLAPLVPAGTPVVAASGIRRRADALRLRRAGATAILVGEALLTARDPGRALGRLLGKEGARCGSG